MKFINRAVEKADMMLKLLGTPVSYGIKALVNGEYGKVENILYSMTSMNWATFEDIGDQSGKFIYSFHSSISLCY